MDWDAAYNNADFIPGAQDYIARWTREAEAFRAAWPRAELNVAYGDHPREAFDLFLPEGAAQGLVVFVHGGYWLRFDRSFWSHFAKGPLLRGWAVALPSYPLCPEVGLPQITASVTRAVEAAATRVAGPLRLAGHSAGGHLVARMASVLPPDLCARLARVVPISPVSDLRPLMQTAMRETLHLDDAVCAAESPVLHPRPDLPVTIWVGAEERPVFLDQARWLAEAWEAGHRVAPGRHHFDVIDGLRDPDSPLTNALLG
ncbi:alpha/beta hydrolase [Tropicimonas sp. S265A]|uniref:alpha/beta hydrolase n=1 Tax=Tropicimonas sp. S265A TaxID=3415134 RepID=UPI003C7BB3FB